MPMKCCIPGCTSNYNGTQGYVKIFSMPNNPIRRQAWVDRIPRENWTPTKSSFVCIKHFEKEYLLMGRQRCKLTDTAVPTIFPDVTRLTNKRYRYSRKRFAAPPAATAEASSTTATQSVANTTDREIPETIGNFQGDEIRSEIVYCEVEDNNVQIKEEPITIDDSATESLDYEKQEEPSSCKDSAYEEPKLTTAESESTEFYRFDLLGEYWKEKMRSLPNDQRIFAEKLINDVLFEAELGRLSHDWYLTTQ